MSELVTFPNTNITMDVLLTGEDVARILQVSRSFAYILMRQGRIPTIRLGRSVRVRPLDLERFISENMSNSESAAVVKREN